MSYRVSQWLAVPWMLFCFVSAPKTSQIIKRWYSWCRRTLMHFGRIDGAGSTTESVSSTDSVQAQQEESTTTMSTVTSPEPAWSRKSHISDQRTPEPSKPSMSRVRERQQQQRKSVGVMGVRRQFKFLVAQFLTFLCWRCEASTRKDKMRVLWSCVRASATILVLTNADQSCGTNFHYEYASDRKADAYQLYCNLTDAGYKAVVVQLPSLSSGKIRDASAFRPQNRLINFTESLVLWLECAGAILTFEERSYALLATAPCGLERKRVDVLHDAQETLDSSSSAVVDISQQANSQQSDNQESNNRQSNNQQSDNQQSNNQQPGNQQPNNPSTRGPTDSSVPAPEHAADLGSKRKGVYPQSSDCPIDVRLRWLLVCVQGRNEKKKLLHIPLRASTNDPELFHSVREAQKRQHFALQRWFSWTGVTKISYTRVCVIS